MATKVIDLKANERALRNERAWLPETLEEAATVRQYLVDHGQPAQVSNGIVGWLVSKASGQQDGSNPATRSRYRKVLAELESPLPSTEVRAHSSFELEIAA